MNPIYREDACVELYDYRSHRRNAVHDIRKTHANAQTLQQNQRNKIIERIKKKLFKK